MTQKTTFRVGALCLIAALSLSACVSVLPKAKPASTVYRLSIPHGVPETPGKLLRVVNIELPKAPRALSGTDIVLSPDGRRLTAAAGASWAEPVPSQLRHALIDKLAGDGRLTGIIPSGGTRAPFRLHIDIRRFEAVFDNGETAAPNAVVTLNLTLTDTNSRRLVGSHSVSTNARARAATVSAIVDAQDIATEEAMHKITAWLGGLIGDNP
ncbi:MAG: hypothetical protein COA91_06420 [Robiginitomaculum sp.]|nr:MAG: hypothetical protein COA91_06420 [Robiginitomaculum sp.]